MSPPILLTYLVAYGGALIAPFVPIIGAYMYISLSILKPTKTWFWSVPDASYSEIVIIAVIIGWLIKRFGSWNFGKAGPVIIYFAAFIGWSCLSMLMVDGATQERSIEFIVLMLKIFLPFLIVMTLIDSVEKLKLLAWCIVVSMGIVAFEENSYFLSMGYVRGKIGMNAIAHEMAMGFGLAVFLGLYSEKIWQKWLSWSIAGLIVHVPFMHMSRGAMIGLLVAGIFTAYKMPKNRKTISLAIFALIMISILAGPSVIEEFSTIFASEEVRDNSAQSRLDLWTDMFTVAISHPLFGIGPSQWQSIAYQFGWPEGKQGHGMWIQFFAELGFVGGGLILTFYLSCVVRLLRTSHQFKGTNNWLLAPLLGVPASTFAWLAEANFGTFWSIETPFYMLLLGAATLKVISVDLPMKESIENNDISMDTLKSQRTKNEKYK